MALEPPADRPLTSVLGDIFSNVQQIVRSEIRLAKAEIREELGPAKRAALLVGAGAVVSVLALGVLLLAAVYALATKMALWAAALLVGIVAAVVGVICFVAAASQFHKVKVPPPKTAASVQETFQWAKARVK